MEQIDPERLDVANGLLLIANLDALFNDGLITFDDDGEMLISGELAQKDRTILQLKGGLRKKPTARQRSYLKFHRENEFRHPQAATGCRRLPPSALP
jgi:hypothetical protein